MLNIIDKNIGNAITKLAVNIDKDVVNVDELKKISNKIYEVVKKFIQFFTNIYNSVDVGEVIEHELSMIRNLLKKVHKIEYHRKSFSFILKDVEKILKNQEILNEINNLFGKEVAIYRNRIIFDHDYKLNLYTDEVVEEICIIYLTLYTIYKLYV